MIDTEARVPVTIGVDDLQQNPQLMHTLYDYYISCYYWINPPVNITMHFLPSLVLLYE